MQAGGRLSRWHQGAGANDPAFYLTAEVEALLLNPDRERARRSCNTGIELPV